MNSAEFEKLLRKHGATVNPAKGKGSHAVAELNGRFAYIPRHGGRKELGKGLVNSVLKQLGIK